MSTHAGLNVTAVLQTQCGNLVMYDSEALVKVIGALPSCGASPPSGHYSDAPPAPPPPELLDGFTIAQWAIYGKLKSEIATRVCRENGALKKRLASIAHPVTSNGCGDGRDSIFENDPWYSARPDEKDRECELMSAPAAHNPIEFKAWSNWRSASAPSIRRNEITKSGDTNVCSTIDLTPQNVADAIPQSSCGLHLQTIPIDDPWRRWHRNDDDSDSADCISFSNNTHSRDSLANLANHTACIGQSNSSTQYDDQPSSYWQRLFETLQTDGFETQLVDMVGSWESLGPSASLAPLQSENALQSEEIDAKDVNGEDLFFQCFGVWPHDGADNIELYLKRALAFRRSPGALTSDTRSGQGYWQKLKMKLDVNSDTECENAISAALRFADSMA